MGTISGAKVVYGLSATGTPIGTALTGTLQVGTAGTATNLSTSDIAYSMRCILAGTGDALALGLSDQDTTGSTAWVAGTAQVETATAAGTITGSGNAEVIVTASGMIGSPKTISVAVLVDDTASDWAEKVRTALAADTDVAAKFDVSGSTTSIVLTRKATSSYTVPGGTLSLYAANDATLNISLDNDTCTGITTAATSANTTAGVVSDGAKIYDADGNDFEGVAMSTMSYFDGFLLENLGSYQINAAGTSNDVFSVAAGSRILIAGNGTTGIALESDYTFTAGGGPCDLQITVLGR